MEGYRNLGGKVRDQHQGGKGVCPKNPAGRVELPRVRRFHIEE
jgi:hypothetical protein